MMGGEAWSSMSANSDEGRRGGGVLRARFAKGICTSMVLCRTGLTVCCTPVQGTTPHWIRQAAAIAFSAVVHGARGVNQARRQGHTNTRLALRLH